MVDTGYGYPLDGYLKTNLDEAIRVVKNDWDMIFCVDGYEGSGKSTLAIQMAYYCDPTLTVERITFTPKEFKNAIMNADKYQAVVFDEAFTGLSSREAMSGINKSLIQMIAEIRQKNLFVFVVMPSFFDLDKYIALHRSRALIHVYANRFQRGFFRFYDIEKKKDLYITGKKFYSYKGVMSNFYGTFSSFLPIDNDAYKKKKHDSLHNKKESDGESTAERREFSKRLFEHLKQFDWIPNIKKAQIIGITEATFYNWVKRDGVVDEDDGDL